MSAAARAEARRKAILSRGSDRLAKLTTSARGEDAPAYMHDDPPLPSLSTGLKNFVGEESTMPTPRSRMSLSPSPPATTDLNNSFSTADLSSTTLPDPSVWSQDQQQQFMQALMGGGPLPQQDSLPGMKTPAVDPRLPPMDNPFAAMLFPQQAGMFDSAATGKAPADLPVTRTRLQKLMPFVHLGAMWCLLAYFIIYKEPQVHEETNGGGGVLWMRWAELGRVNSIGDIVQIFKIQFVPFFWAFTTLQIILHSVRIFSGFDAVQPPTLLALALPHLPPPLPSIIINALKYMQMGSMFLDDLSGLVVGIGLIVLFSGWFAAA